METKRIDFRDKHRARIVALVNKFELDYEYGYIDGKLADEKRMTLTTWGFTCPQLRALLELQVRHRLFSEVRVGPTYLVFIAARTT